MVCTSYSLRGWFPVATMTTRLRGGPRQTWLTFTSHGLVFQSSYKLADGRYDIV